MEHIVLKNNNPLPLLGLGTYLMHGKVLDKAVKLAYVLGYRCFDTAWLYKNEKDLGRTIKGLQEERDSLFVTSKIDWKQFCFVYPKLNIWTTKKRKSIRKCVDDTLRRLNMNYVDLYLIHWPNPEYYIEIWETLLAIYGRQIKSLGVANFLQSHIEVLYAKTGVYPEVNQIELHPLNTQKTLIAYCRKHGIAIQAHTPLAQGSKELLENNVLLSLSRKYEKTVPQIVLRWIVQQGIAVCPKSIHYNRLKENIEIFDFYLTDSDMSLIDSLNEDKYFHNDPHKTLQ